MVKPKGVFLKPLFGATLCVVGLTALVLLSDSVLATPAMQTALLGQYPEIREAQNNSCITCHMPVVEDFLNSYGLAVKEAKMDFEAIDELDSDGAGAPNGEEIRDGRFPGSQAPFPEYFIFHVDFSKEDPDLGKIHFNHEQHTIKDSFLSKGRCANCHGKDLFPKRFDDTVSVRPLAHMVCWRCHETSGSKLAPKDCVQCHTGIEAIMQDIKALLEE